MKTTLKTAALAATLISATATMTAAQADESKGKCHGVNSCQGKSVCATAESACSGHNSCKGKGWLVMDKATCEAQDGKFEAL